MKIRSIILGAAAGGCAAGMVLPPAATAAVSDEAFNTLSNLVNQQGQMLNELKKTHEQDQKEIQDLREQLGQTQALATNAVQQAQAAAAQPVFPAPNPATSATHNFMMVGDAEVQFGKTADQNATFQLADFAPIFLFRANDNVLFEAGFDMMLNNNFNPDGTRAADSSTSVSISFAQMDYAFNDYMTLVAGYMLLPLGTYNERGAGWLNKIPDAPLADDQLLPGAGAGVQLRGALPIGQMGQSLTYAIYTDNGPSSGTLGSAGASDLDLAGNVGDTPNWHSAPSGGGRIGWFYPWGLHKDLELGVSGQTGEWSDSGNRQWSAAVLDAALHLGPYFEAKGEYINTWAETDNGNLNPNGWWVQASYKLAGLKLDWPVVRNLELVSRYDHLNDDGLFNGGAGGTTTDRYTAGYVYYFSNTLLFEGDYEWMDIHGPNPNALPASLWVLQLSYGF
jgi:hypothetical protein